MERLTALINVLTPPGNPKDRGKNETRFLREAVTGTKWAIQERLKVGDRPSYQEYTNALMTAQLELSRHESRNTSDSSANPNRKKKRIKDRATPYSMVHTATVGTPRTSAMRTTIRTPTDRTNTEAETIKIVDQYGCVSTAAKMDAISHAAASQMTEIAFSAISGCGENKTASGSTIED